LYTFIPVLSKDFKPINRKDGEYYKNSWNSRLFEYTILEQTLGAYFSITYQTHSSAMDSYNNRVFNWIYNITYK
jgi:hypothetical protein